MMINNYYKMFDEANSFEDIKKIIILVNSDIDYYQKINRIDKLLELKKLLHLLEVTSLYIIKKKFDEVLPMIQEVRSDMLKDNMNKYLEMYKMMDSLDVLNVSFKKNAGLDELNDWLIQLFRLYKDNGYVVTSEDFKNIFDTNISNYKKNNIIINEYMSLFFELIGTDFDCEIENDKMVDKVFEMGNRGLLPEIKSDENPILDVVKLAVLKFNNMHEDIILDKINEISFSVGFGKINSKRLSIYKDKVKDNVLLLQDKLKKMSEGDISYILPEYNEMYVTVKDIEDDMKIYELCNLLTNGRYKELSDKDRDCLFKDLPIIMDTIIKCKLFNELSSLYDSYSSLNDYDEIKTGIYRSEVEVANLTRELIIKEQEYNDLLAKKTGIKYKYSLKKKDKDIGILVDTINKKKEEFEVVTKRLKNFYKQRSEYIYGFNHNCSTLEFVKKHHINGMNSMNKIFGVFDFEYLPITDINIGKIEVFRKYQIKLPEIKSQKFEYLNGICLKLMNSPLLKNRIDNNIRIKTDIDDKYLEMLHDGKFDKLIDTVILDKNDEVTINKKRR